MTSKRGRHSLLKAHTVQSNAEFGDVFAAKNKPASKKFLPSCLVTVHDYGFDRYEINGKNVLVPCGQNENVLNEQRFSDPETLLNDFPFLRQSKPDWADVRLICSLLRSRANLSFDIPLTQVD